MFRGYYKNEEETRKAVDEEGWLHTGDIVTLNENGSVTIIDRIKSIFKLSQGEYVAPEKVEKSLRDIEGIQEIFIYGDSLKNYCVGVVYLSEDCSMDTEKL